MGYRRCRRPHLSACRWLVDGRLVLVADCMSLVADCLSLVADGLSLVAGGRWLVARCSSRVCDFSYLAACAGLKLGLGAELELELGRA